LLSPEEVLRLKQEEEERARAAEVGRLRSALAEQLQGNAYLEAHRTAEELRQIEPSDPEARRALDWLGEHIGDWGAGLYRWAVALSCAVIVLWPLSLILFAKAEPEPSLTSSNTGSYPASPSYPSKDPYMGKGSYGSDTWPPPKSGPRTKASSGGLGWAWGCYVLALCAQVALVAVVAVFGFRAWRLIQDRHAPLTPGAAVGLMFIPIFNVVWCFLACRGLARSLNDFSKRREIGAPEVSEGLAIGYCALFAGLYIPLLNVLVWPAAVIVGLLVMRQMRHSAAAIAWAASRPGRKKALVAVPVAAVSV
jgi:hypothetical protein